MKDGGKRNCFRAISMTMQQTIIINGYYYYSKSLGTR